MHWSENVVGAECVECSAKAVTDSPLPINGIFEGVCASARVALN